MTKEEIKKQLSGILDNTNQQHPMTVHIPIETGEEVGLSTLEMLTIDKLWMDVTGTSIRFTMYGVDGIHNLDDHEDWMSQILEYFKFLGKL